MLEPLAASRFDLILANPPYVPGAHPAVARGAARAWEGGSDGRVLVERLCAEAPACLRPGGSVLLVQSSLTGEEETLQSLSEVGLEPEVAARERGTLGPIVAARAEALEVRGLLAPGEREEEILVIRGTARRSTTFRVAMRSARVEGD
jgi:release factor glutamine methyltransferase